MITGSPALCDAKAVGIITQCCYRYRLFPPMDATHPILLLQLLASSWRRRWIHILRGSAAVMMLAEEGAGVLEALHAEPLHDLCVGLVDQRRLAEALALLLGLGRALVPEPLLPALHPAAAERWQPDHDQPS